MKALRRGTERGRCRSAHCFHLGITSPPTASTFANVARDRRGNVSGRHLSAILGAHAGRRDPYRLYRLFRHPWRLRILEFLSTPLRLSLSGHGGSFADERHVHVCVRGQNERGTERSEKGFIPRAIRP